MTWNKNSFGGEFSFQNDMHSLWEPLWGRDKVIAAYSLLIETVLFFYQKLVKTLGRPLSFSMFSSKLSFFLISAPLKNDWQQSTGENQLLCLPEQKMVCGCACFPYLNCKPVSESISPSFCSNVAYAVNVFVFACRLLNHKDLYRAANH